MTNGFYGKTITIDLSNGEKITVAAQQNDTGRYLNIAIKDKGVDYDLTGKTIRAYVIKADGNKCFVDCDIVTDDENVTNLCRMEITSQMLALNNKAIVQLKITDGENFIKSYPFEIMSNRDYTDDAAIESSNEYTALENMIKSIDSGNYNTDVKEAVSKYIADNGISAKASAITLNDNTTVEDTISSLKEDLVNLDNTKESKYERVNIIETLCLKAIDINEGKITDSNFTCSTIYINFKKDDEVYILNNYGCKINFYDNDKNYVDQKIVNGKYTFNNDTVARLTIYKLDNTEIDISDATANLKAFRYVLKETGAYLDNLRYIGYNNSTLNSIGIAIADDTSISNSSISLNLNDKITIDTNIYKYKILLLDINNNKLGYTLDWITTLDEFKLNGDFNICIFIKKKEESTDKLTEDDFKNAVKIKKWVTGNDIDIINIKPCYNALKYGLSQEHESNSRVFQNIIDFVAVKGGGTIYIPNGTYKFSNVDGLKALIPRDGVEIVGENKYLTKLIMNDNNGASYALFYKIESDKSSLKNACFSNFTVDGSELTQWSVRDKAFYMQYLEHCKFDNLNLIGTPATALGVDYLNDVVIQDNTCIDCGHMWNSVDHKEGSSGIGIGTSGFENENFIITNNVCVGSGQYGIFVESQKLVFSNGDYAQSKGMVISNNIVRGGLNHGIGVRGVNGLTIVGNNSYENTNDGIHIEGGTNITVSGNNSFSNKNNGIYLDNSVCSCDSININGNNFNANSNYGIILNDTVKTGMSYKNVAISSNLTSDNIVKGAELKGNIENLYVNGNALFDGIENNATVTGVNTVQTA